jgi:aspartate carbamoyltransferase catalytic subunit
MTADVINFSAKGSSVAKGESLKDTALMLKAMSADEERVVRLVG